MTEEVFRIIIAVAVGLACLMFIVQAFVMMERPKAVSSRRAMRMNKAILANR